MAQTFTQVSSDTFTRSNAATLGANWVTLLGSFQISGNTAQSPSAVSEGAWIGSGTWPNDQYAECKISARANSSCMVGAICRARVSNGSSVDGYFGGVYNTGNPYVLVRIFAGGYTVLATSGTNVSVGDTVRLVVTGQPATQAATNNFANVPFPGSGVSLTLFVNGVSNLTFTDVTTGIGSGVPGFFVSPSGGTANASVQNWAAGTVTTPPTLVNATPLQLIYGANMNLGTITAINQALEFTLPSPQQNSGTMKYGGRLQLIVTTGQLVNPQWVLECSQDNWASSFILPAAILPTKLPQLGDTPSVYAPWYDCTGLGGARFRFGLSSGTILANPTVFAMVG